MARDPYEAGRDIAKLFMAAIVRQGTEGSVHDRLGRAIEEVQRAVVLESLADGKEGEDG